MSEPNMHKASGASPIVVRRVVGARRKPTLKQMVEAAHAAGATVSVGLKPRLLYDEVSEQTDLYTFKINGGGDLDVKEFGQVTITFKDGRFESATYPFSGNYTRNGWRILADIESKISDIENLRRECPNAALSGAERKP